MIDAMRVTMALLMAPLLAASARAEGDAARGEARFEECAACHRLEAGVNEVGPSLHGIFMRKAGELRDFRYSPAMKRSAITWTPETLEKYITDPQAMVPANRMPYAGMANAGDRADLIAYLLKATNRGDSSTSGTTRLAPIKQAWAPAQQRITPPVRRAAQRPGNERPELPVSRTRRSVLDAAPQSRDPSGRGLAFFARWLTAFCANQVRWS